MNRKRRDSTVSVQPQTSSTRRRSLRNVPSFSAMIKSTSLRSMDPDQVSIASSSTTSNKFASFTSRRQSLTRATASSLAKMVKMSSSDAQPPPPSPTTTEKKKPSRFNKLLKRQSQIKDEQQQLLPSPPDTPLPSVTTTTNKKRASWSPFGLLRHNNNHQYEPVSPASSLEDNIAPAPQLPPLDPEDESGFLLDPVMNERRRSLAIGSSTSTRASSKRHSTGSSFSHHQIQPSVSMRTGHGCEACTRRKAARRRSAITDDEHHHHHHHHTHSRSNSIAQQSSSFLTNSSTITTASSTNGGGHGKENLHKEPLKESSRNGNPDHVVVVDQPPSPIPRQVIQERSLPQSTPPPAPPTIAHPAEIQDSVELDVERTIALLEQAEQEVIIEEPVKEEQQQEFDQQTVVIEEPVAIEQPVEQPIVIEQPVEQPIVIEQPIEQPVVIEHSVEQPVEQLVIIKSPVEQFATIEQPVEPSVEEPPVVIEHPVSVEQPIATEQVPEQSVVEQVTTQTIDEAEPVAPTNASIAIMHPLFNFGDRAALVPTTEESSSLIQLVASCIAHADKLERLAQELSRSEYRVSELLQAHQSLIQSLDAREHRYKEHVATYQRLLSTQSRMLNELEEMLSHKPPSTTVYIPTHKPSWWQQIIPHPEQGAIVSRQYNEFGHTTDIVVAGTCVTAEPNLVPQQLIVSSEEHQREQGLLYHHYLLHIPHDDRSTKFKLMPEDKWIPDDSAAGCQFRSCEIQFDLLHRRHHCRSCGNIFCYKHSANQLPLFKPLNRDQGEWARVCDDCFYQLLGRS